MNTVRMFAFVAAVLITAFFFRVIAHGLNDEQTPHAATQAAAANHKQAAGG